MYPKLITNTEGNHVDIINKGISSADRVIICVAFLKTSGLTLIKECLAKALNKGTNVKIVIGLDFFLTEPKALWDTFNMCEPYKNATLLLCTQNKNTFHPKLYYWAKNGNATVVIGSANLTSGGLAVTVEVSVLYKLKVESQFVERLFSFVSELERNDRVSPATRLSLSQYQRRYEIFNKKRKEAEKEAERETKNLFTFDETKLLQYLSDTRKSPQEQKQLQRKRANYKKARNLLERLATENIGSKQAFLEVYDQLVGAKDTKSLWHSGGLFRLKEKVARSYRQFVRLLRALRSNIEATADVLIDISRQNAQQINGLGLNVITEIMNTYAPKKFAVLNRNPVSSLAHLGFEEFGSLNKKVFSGAKYAKFNSLIQELGRLCGFSDLAEVDHFLNYVYWNYAKPKQK